MSKIFEAVYKFICNIVESTNVAENLKSEFGEDAVDKIITIMSTIKDMNNIDYTMPPNSPITYSMSSAESRQQLSILDHYNISSHKSLEDDSEHVAFEFGSTTLLNTNLDNVFETTNENVKTETAMATANENAMATANETAMATANETAMATVNETAMATVNETAMTTANENAMATANENAMATANENAMATAKTATAKTATAKTATAKTATAKTATAKTATAKTATAKTATAKTATAKTAKTKSDVDIPLEKNTIAQLKDKCRSFDLKPVGNKQALVDILKSYKIKLDARNDTSTIINNGLNNYDQDIDDIDIDDQDIDDQDIDQDIGNQDIKHQIPTKYKSNNESEIPMTTYTEINKISDSFLQNNIDAITIHELEDGLHVCQDTSLVFNPDTEIVVGWMDAYGSVLPLTVESIELCKQHGYEYKIV